MYFPALPTVAKDLNVSVELVNLSVTSYLIFQGLAPTLWGPVSDVMGRRVAYCCTFVVFLGACIGLAETKTYAALIILRCLQSTGSASTISIGSGVIGDITTREERGGFMGVFQAGLLAPVAIGPIIGGALSGSMGWHSVFWFLTIYGGIFLVVLVVLQPETLRSIVGNGSVQPTTLIQKWPLNMYRATTKTKSNQQDAPNSPRKKIDLLGPLRILCSKQTVFLIGFLAIYYAVWQMSITAISSLFEERYGLSETQIGLTFIANGAGSIIGTLITGKILNLDYQKVKATFEARVHDGSDGIPESEEDRARQDDFPIEAARLRLVPIFALVQCLSVLVFGWSIQYPRRVPIAIPIISTFFSGWTVISTQSIIMTYLVDVFPDRSAAASASINLARCLCAAGGTSFIMPLVNAIGVGPAFSICAAAQLVGLFGAGVQWKYGPQWRRENEAQNQH